MNASLETRAEVLKLARLLDRDPEDLAFLAPLPATAVRRFREQATDVLFEADRRRLQRLAAASARLPLAVVAAIGERSFGPLLCARIAGMLEPARAVEVASRLPADFLAAVAVQLDPRRAIDVITGIPAEQIGAITAELVRRGEDVTMGRFVGHLPEGSLAAALAAIDDASLLRIAFVTEDKKCLDRVVGLLDEERLTRVIGAAARDGLWPEALDLVGCVGERRRAELAELAAAQEDDVLESLVRSAHEEGMWDAVLPLLGSMSPEGRGRFAGLGVVRSDGVLEDAVRAAATNRLWPHLLPLAPLLPPAGRTRVAAALVELEGRDGDRALASVVDVAEELELWEAVLRLIADLDAPLQGRLAGSVARLSKRRRQRMAARAREREMLERLGAVAEALTTG